MISPGNYILRNGWKARMLCDDAPGPYPVVGYLLIPSIEGVCVYKWAKDGAAPSLDGTSSQIDILHADYEPDWANAPDWAQWFAVDSQGWPFWWKDEPTPSFHRWSGERSQCVDRDVIDMTNINWKETLRKRP